MRRNKFHNIFFQKHKAKKEQRKRKAFNNSKSRRNKNKEAVGKAAARQTCHDSGILRFLKSKQTGRKTQVQSETHRRETKSYLQLLELIFKRFLNNEQKKRKESKHEKMKKNSDLMHTFSFKRLLSCSF
jgi:hypothetical protein